MADVSIIQETCLKTLFLIKMFNVQIWTGRTLVQWDFIAGGATQCNVAQIQRTITFRIVPLITSHRLRTRCKATDANEHWHERAYAFLELKERGWGTIYPSIDADDQTAVFLRWQVGSQLTCKKEEGHLVPHSWKPPPCSSPWSLLETQCCLAASWTLGSAACCLQTDRERERRRERERSARSTYRHPSCLQNKLLAGGSEQASTALVREALESQTTSRRKHIN